MTACRLEGWDGGTLGVRSQRPPERQACAERQPHLANGSGAGGGLHAEAGNGDDVGFHPRVAGGERGAVRETEDDESSLLLTGGPALRGVNQLD